LAEGRPDEAGQLAGAVTELQHRLGAVADRLQAGGVDGVLRDTGEFARRRPLVFLVACAGAGFVLGRMVRTMRAADGGADQQHPRSVLSPAPTGASTPEGLAVAGMSGAVPGAVPHWGNDG